jgi:hypothetical protein
MGIRDFLAGIAHCDPGLPVIRHLLPWIGISTYRLGDSAAPKVGLRLSILDVAIHTANGMHPRH